MDEERIRELTDEIRADIEGRLANRGAIIGAPEPTGSGLLAVREATQRQLVEVMQRMGFEAVDVAAAVESVEVMVASDNCIAATFDVPGQVEAYFAAVRRCDFDRATMLLAAREG